MDIQAIKNEIEDLRFNEYYIDDNKIDVCKLYKILDKYDTKDMIIIPHNSNKEVPEELKTILKLSTDVMFSKDDMDTLNKGIDELLKKYEAYKKMYKEMYEKTGENIYKTKMYLFKYFIQDLKKLKGE